MSILLEYCSVKKKKKKFLIVVSSLTSSLGVNDITDLWDVTLSIKIKKRAVVPLDKELITLHVWIAQK